MTPLPVEGTLFAHTYVSETKSPAGGPARTAGVGLFCEDPPSRSVFHRLEFDELWHFYAGDPLRLVLLHPDGCDAEVILDPDRRQFHRRYVRSSDPGDCSCGGARI